MRLGQLARKLAISPTDIIKFLESNSIAASEGSNTRLTDDTTRLILQQFDPAGTIVLSAEQPEETEATPIAETPAPEVEETPAPAPVVEPQSIAAEAESTHLVAEDLQPEESTAPEADEATEQPDVIKAQKVSLAGLKVLGKIELPEPKKKEPATPEDTTDAPQAIIPTQQPEPAQERRPRREREGDRRDARDGDGRRPRHSDNRRNDKLRKNPIAMQREREAQEAQFKREAEAKAEKERRTQHYHSKVKSVPTKPARLLHEQTEEFTDDHVSTPATWLGKFWRWFRS